MLTTCRACESMSNKAIMVLQVSHAIPCFPEGILLQLIGGGVSSGCQLGLLA